MTDEAVCADVDEAPRPKRGFAALDPEARRAIASKGGAAAHALGKAHRWTKETAAEAGRKGGSAKGRRRKEQA